MSMNTKNNLWESTCNESSKYKALSENQTTDITIVGGGFTGCSAALEAASLGAKVTLLEANDIGYGGSGRNVGLVNAGLWLPPKKIVEILGERQGQSIISELGRAPELVFSIIEKNHIDCEAQKNGTLHCAHSNQGMDYLTKRKDQADIYDEPISLIDKNQTDKRTGSSSFYGALFDPRAGTIQPLAYCKGLARAAESSGAKVYTNSKVKKIEKINGIWHVYTATNTVKSKLLLLAMNAYQNIEDKKLNKQFSTVYYSQFSTKPLSSNKLSSILPQKEGCWDTATIMSSFRIDKSGRLIIGTMGAAKGFGEKIHLSWAKKKLQSLFPFLLDVEFDHIWQGKIAMTKDHIPKIVNFSENALSCFGYSGRGIAPGTLFGSAMGKALITDNYSLLPIDPIENYREILTREKSFAFEIGSTINHAIQSIRM